MTVKPLIASVVAAGVLALAVWGYLAGRAERATEAERERPVKAPSRVTQDNGESVITLDSLSQVKSGVVMTPPQSAAYHQTRQALATVLPLDELISVRTAWVAAKSQVDKARAALQASAPEYSRLEQLHTEDRDISDRALQAAEAAKHADEAALRAAQASLDAAEQTARQQWGSVLMRAAMEQSPLWTRLVTRQSALLQITLPAGTEVTRSPEKAVIKMPNGRLQSTTLISPSPRTDPRLQGLSFYYSIPSAELLPGTALTAYLPVGPDAQGALVPVSAVVWWQGRAWIYTQRAPTRFVRRELPTDNPADDGWFVPRGFAAGEPIVSTGAQLLLSEEQRSQIAVGEEGQ